MNIDHIIMKVNDLDASVDFYTNIMGFTNDGTQGPFTVIQVSSDFQIQLAPWGTEGYEHYAFSMSPEEFDEIFRRIKESNIDYGPDFHSVGNNTGPGREAGAKGEAPTIYFLDPSKHLIEILSYEK
ncbi:MAG: VOC family protein [Pseudohongiellaceae bacterium]